MTDIEHLIIAVEGFPCLWDIHHEDYYNRDLKDVAWQQICKELDNNWESLDVTQKLNSCNSIKKKWNHLSDYYRKDLQKSQNTPSGSGAKKHKTYTYAPFLEFLRPTFERRQSEGNHVDAAKGSNTDPSPEDPLLQNQENNVVQHSTALPSTPEVHESSSQVSTKIIKKKKDVPSAILDILQRRTQAAAPITNSQEDDDDKFLLSFRSDMKKMNHSQKLDFKIGMLQLMKKITASNESQNSRPSTSSSNYLSSNSGTPLSYFDATQQNYPENTQYQYVLNVPEHSMIKSNTPSQQVQNKNYGYVLNIPEHNNSTYQTNITSPTPPNNPRVVIQSVTNIPQCQNLGDADDNNILGDYLLFPKDKSS